MLGEVNKGHRENTQQKESLTKAEMKVLTMKGSGHGARCAQRRGRGGALRELTAPARRGGGTALISSF